MICRQTNLGLVNSQTGQLMD